MAHDEGKEDKFDFTDEGEAKYIGLDEARILAIQTANETPGDYGPRFSDVRMVFEPQEEEETEEYYRIVLAVRPQGEFSGAAGREEFYIDKLAQAGGAVAHRQVLAVPASERGRRPVLVLVAVALVVVVIASGAVGGLYIGGVLPPTASTEDGPVEVSKPPQPPAQPVSADAVMPDGSIEAALFPQSPALLVSPDNTVIVNVPIGSVPESATLRYEPVNLQTVPRLAAGYSRVVRAFDLTITDAKQSGIEIQLEQPITVTLALTDADIRVAGGDGTNLVIQHFKSDQSVGEPLDSKFDAQNRTVSAEVTSLSIFALTVRSEPELPAPATPTPTETPIAVPSVVPTPTLTPEPTYTPIPTLTPTPTVTPAPTVTPTSTATLAPTVTNTIAPTMTPTPTPTPSPSPTPTAVFTSTPTRIPSPTPIPPTPTPSPTRTPSPPNLVPFQPELWSAPLVISDTRTAYLDTPPPGGTEFVFGSRVFVHWAVRNESRLPVTQPFQVGIAIDGDLKITFPVERLDSNEVARKVNVELSVDSPGQHRFELIVDVDNRITERNERDNVYAVSPRWVNPTPTATMTPTASPMVTPTPTHTRTPTPNPTPSVTVVSTPTVTPTPTLTVTITQTATPIVSTSLADTAWPMFRHDTNHTARSAATGPQIPAEKWSFTTGGFVDSSPAIGADGTIYVGSRDGNLYAVNPDGTLRWKFATGLITESSPAIAADGTIYVGSEIGTFYAVDPGGTLKWKVDLGSIRSSPAIAQDGTVYIGTYSNGTHFYALRPTGAILWSINAQNGFTSSAAVGADGTVYVGARDNQVYALHPDGRVKWKYATDNAVESSPAIGITGSIFVGSTDHILYALDSDGQLIGGVTTGNQVARSSPGIGTDGTIYVGSLDGKLYAMNPDGSQRWVTVIGQAIYSSPAVGSDGVIYIASTSGKLSAVNSNGTFKWGFSTGAAIYSSPAIGSDGTIYVGSEDGKLYAIGEAPATPTPTRTPIVTPTPTRTPTVTPTTSATPTASPTGTPTPPVEFKFVSQWGVKGRGAGEFMFPTDIAITDQGNIYVTDEHRIQKFDSKGTFVRQWQHENAFGMTTDSQGNIYVLGTPKGFWSVTKYSSGGGVLAEWGTTGSGIGQFWNPAGIAVDPVGNVYVADSHNHRIQKFTGDGKFLSQWGSEGTGDGEFQFPWGIAVDGAGDVYVVDKNSYRVQKFDADGNFLLTWGTRGTGQGQFDLPDMVAASGTGHIYVSDRNNQRVQAFNRSGEFIGEWGSPGSQDGQFFNPEGIAVDSTGKIYVVENDNHRVQVFAIK